MNEKEKKFMATIVRCVFDQPGFKVYAADVDKEKYPEIKRNKYKNVSLVGDLVGLNIDAEYEVTAIEQTSKFGTNYKVINIRRDAPLTPEGVQAFLCEILTERQAAELYNHYPDIIQRVRENRLEDIDLNKLHGIKEVTFNRIKEKIVENFFLFDLVVLFRGVLSMSIIKKLYDKYPSVETFKSKLQADPYRCLCNLAGVGFRTADDLLLKMEKASIEDIKSGKQPVIQFDCDLRTSLQRCRACLQYLIEQNELSGHTKMQASDLRVECMKMASKCAHHFFEALQCKYIYFNEETNEVALSATYDVESYIASTIIGGLANRDNLWNYNPEKYRNVDGIMLSNEQLQAVSNVCKYSVSILNGAAGTGKSFSTQAIINMLEDHRKTYRLFSPTGKAAKVLANYTKRPASTIHRGLGWKPEGSWTYNDSNKIESDVIIVDEFSMVDIRLFKRLLEAIDFNRTKLLLIGDNAQLPSVSCGNLLHDFMETRLIPTVTLKTVFRYSDGGLMKVATDVRFRQSYLNQAMKNKATVFGDNRDYTFVDVSSDSTPQSVVQLYKKLLEAGNSIENIQVLTAKNKGECGAIALNNVIQQIANPNYGKTLNIKQGEATYFVGDLVIQRANNYNALVDPAHYTEEEKEHCAISGEAKTAFIANGETGIVREVQPNYAIIEFDGIFVKYFLSELKDVSLGYAITIHKSQGSSIDNVILCTPRSHIFMLNSNLIYVGLTRMRKRCFHLGSLDTVNNAVYKKENFVRHTFMQRMLKNCVQLISARN